MKTSVGGDAAAASDVTPRNAATAARPARTRNRRLLRRRREPLYQRHGALRVGDEPVDEPSLDEEAAGKRRERHDEPLSLEQLGARMRRVEAARDLLERVVRSDGEPGPPELLQDRREPASVRIVEHRGAEACQLSRVHHVLPGGDERLAHGEVQVERRGRRRTAAAAVDRDVTADVRLVRRLVLREPDVAMDAEHLRGRERMPLVDRVETIADLREARLHRREPAVLVFAAVLLEPVATLVLGEGAEETPCAIREAREALGLLGGGVPHWRGSTPEPARDSRIRRPLRRRSTSASPRPARTTG